MSQWIAKQVLDRGSTASSGRMSSTVEEARNAVDASPLPAAARGGLLRAGRPARRRAGTRRRSYWGIDAAGLLPARRRLATQPRGRGPGRDHVRGEAGDPQPAEDAEGGAGHRRRASSARATCRRTWAIPRQYEHPKVAAAIDEILAICKEHNVVCGHPHVDSNNVATLVEKGFRWLMPAPVYSFAALELGRKVSGRA